MSFQQQYMQKPHNFYCHKILDPCLQTLGKYEIIEKLGEGAFGQVYKVFDRQQSTLHVIKVNKLNGNAMIKKECDILKQLSSSDGFAKLSQYSANQPSQQFIVMSLLGLNLEQVMQKSGLNIIDIKRIGYQLVLRLKQLHDKGYVHRDLKPQNIMFGNAAHAHKVYLVDFGLSATFKLDQRTARKIYAGQIGTISFCGVASHSGQQQFPKDDLESLGYVLTYLMQKSLPWTKSKWMMEQQKQKEQEYEKVKKMKESINIDKMTNASCLKKYLAYTRTLKIGHPVDYQKLLAIFDTQSRDQYCFSFCQQDCAIRSKLCKQNCNDEVDEDISINKVFNF